jgi:ABC-type sugar transport system permease subunit
MKLHRLLLAPSLGTILIFMALPIGLTTIYSVLTPAQYGSRRARPMSGSCSSATFSTTR